MTSKDYNPSIRLQRAVFLRGVVVMTFVLETYGFPSLGSGLSELFNPFPHTHNMQQTTLNIFCKKEWQISIID